MLTVLCCLILSSLHRAHVFSVILCLLPKLLVLLRDIVVYERTKEPLHKRLTLRETALSHYLSLNSGFPLRKHLDIVVRQLH